MHQTSTNVHAEKERNGEKKYGKTKSFAVTMLVNLTAANTNNNKKRKIAGVHSAAPRSLPRIPLSLSIPPQLYSLSNLSRKPYADKKKQTFNCSLAPTFLFSFYTAMAGRDVNLWLL